MRVALLNTFDTAGGAARAMHRLYVGLGRLGIDRSLYVARRDSDDPAIIPVRAVTVAEQAEYQAAEEAVRAEEAPYPRLRTSGFVPFHSERAARAQLLEQRLRDADVFNLHWTRGLVDWAHFMERRGPHQALVWTLHDQNIFTGGCHYTGDCERYTRACGACPMLDSTDEGDLSAVILSRKRAALTRLRAPLHIVTPSRWMAAEAARSSLLRDRPIHVIPNGLDIDTYRPRDRDALRLRRGIDCAATVVLFVSHALDDPRKGYAHLKAALDTLPGADRLVLLLAGEGQVPPPVNVPVIHAGTVRTDADMAELYALADLVAVPSGQENFPNTGLEALACGTAVIGFDLGGLPDMIRSGRNGILAPRHDTACFTAALREALSDRDRLIAWGREGRDFVERECSLERVAARYAALYATALAGTAAAGSRRR